jgi:hypothetical protein
LKLIDPTCHPDLKAVETVATKPTLTAVKPGMIDLPLGDATSPAGGLQRSPRLTPTALAHSRRDAIMDFCLLCLAAVLSWVGLLVALYGLWALFSWSLHAVEHLAGLRVLQVLPGL